MGRILDFLIAVGCFALISALWLAALGMLTSVLMQNFYAFNPLDLPAWKILHAGLLQGGTVPLGFFLSMAAAIALAGAGEIVILWRLPSIAATMPSPHLPRFALPRLALPRLRLPKPSAWRAIRPRPEPVIPPPPPPSQPPPPPATEMPVEKKTGSDSAILARILSLFEVWNEPPPAWMAEALRDEVILLSPDAWPTLESLGSQGLDLLVALQAHDMLPESPAALRAIGEVEAVLRAGIAIDIPPAAEPAVPLPMLTLAASWLCEALENFLAAQAQPDTPPERLGMARTMFEQALRGMSETDWASLDRFPEKANRVRVLTDRLREDLRRPQPIRPSTLQQPSGPPPPPHVPASPVETIIALLKQFGFALGDGSLVLDQGPLLAQREDSLLLLQAIDLGNGDWRLPEGLFGPWVADGSRHSSSPGRQFWQQMARRRLRQPDSRPLAGLLVLHGGRITQEDLLAALVETDRRRSGIGLAWLESGGAGPLPSLQEELADLHERALRERRRDRSADHSAASP